MKKIILVLLLVPVKSLACIVPPVQLQASESYGFKIEEKAAEFFEATNEIKIIAPLKYEGREFDLGIYSVFLSGILVSKSIHSSINDSGEPEFLGYVSNEPGFSYSVSFLYGEGRCKSFEFIVGNGAK